ncbi:MAG: carbohydrate binding family 9 domain-containing protein [Gemmatimonadota bacterium]|nr:carbohydrate binding family 9 domain-containing protein [Gemmatimonadota bacterium]MDH5761157.1 carbohydrate binding family 9 domain-containing protein [Gemmatimonadota bacterium]
MARPAGVVFSMTVMVGLLPGPVHAQTSLPATITDSARRHATATALTEPVRVDGRLDEAAWRGKPLTDFTQAEPREGLPASEDTEVWLAYDESNLYVAAYLHDSQTPTVNDIRKDFNDSSQDVFQVILDTFRDRRNGYVFMTNPEGARGDRQVAGEGREINSSYDAIWRVETARVADGWTVEMEIPFRALRFDPANDVWGINFGRTLRRNNEVAYWAPIPRAYTFYRLSLAGDLSGLPMGTPGRDLRVKPFALAGTVRETGGTGFTNQREAGVDVKYRITEGLTLDVTANPDFAQVEADQQRVNLTQYSLFYQEKREFFLENSGLFYVGDAARNSRVRLTPTPDEDLLLFYSRRIGIGADRRAVPIDGGIRVTGQAAGLSVGGLWMRTNPAGDELGSDYGVLRVRRNLFAGSDVGGIVMMRDAVGDESSYNRVYGADAYIRFPGAIDWSSYYVQTESPLFDAGQYAWRTSLNREGNFHHVKFGLMEIGDGFTNDLGFFKRTGVRKYFLDWGVRPRPESFRAIGVREIHPHVVWNYFDDLSGDIVAKRFHSGVTFFLETGGNVQLAVDHSTEFLERPYSLDSRIDSIAVGRHDWATWVLSGSTDASQLISADYRVSWGGLWTGTQQGFSGGITVRPSYRFRSTVSLDRTEWEGTDTPESFTKTFWTVRTNYSFNKDMFVDALVQVDRDTRQVNSNVRFNLIHSPLSDIFVVWNEQRFQTDEAIAPGRSFTIKVTQMLAF